MSSNDYPRYPILLVDESQQFLTNTSLALGAAGINHIVQCQDSSEVMPILSQEDVSLVVLDLLMPGLSGRSLLQQIVTNFPEIPVIVLTAVNNVETVVECMKNGAFDYIVKPGHGDRLAAATRRGLEIHKTADPNCPLADTIQFPGAFSDIVTQDQEMYSIFQYVEKIAPTALPVLITGETGVGKELIASALHKLSGRQGAFVRVNVAGLDDQLFSDTLFGHKRGAYTGADSDRKGLIENASLGTLFLDEIGDLHLESQVKLLRLLEEGTYYRLGDDFETTSSTRTIVATNREIQYLRDSENFRTDLYYRLKSYYIHLPPLRERTEDIPMLVAYFLESVAKEMDKQIPAATKELLDLLGTHSFPGNVRELKGMVTNAVSQHKGGALSTDFFRQAIKEQSIAAHEDTILQARAIGVSALPILPNLKEALKETEQLFIGEALKRADGNQTVAAKLLGLSKSALHKRLSRARTSSDDA